MMLNSTPPDSSSLPTLAILSQPSPPSHSCPLASFVMPAVRSLSLPPPWTFCYHSNLVLQGMHTQHIWLWELDLQQPIHLTSHHCHLAMGHDTAANLVAFAHAALFSPALSTLAKAMCCQHVPKFAGLTLAQLCHFPPTSMAMHQGHLDQSRQNQRSTKADEAEHMADCYPEEVPDGHKLHACFAAIVEPLGQIYTDQTGKFPAPSSTGNNYIMVLYDHDSNAILTEPFKNRNADTILAAFKVLHACLCRAGLRPRLQRLDNEASTALKDFLTATDIDFQLVPPYVHRRNTAERAIRTFKNHFIAGLCSTDKDFPLHLWDRLLPQAELTLNLLRGCRCNPKLSAWAYIHGAFDFNRTPIAPPGTRVLAHVKPDARSSWAPHGLEGWYVGPAWAYYRCYTVWVTKTRAARICDTITWFPTHVRMPAASSTDYILAGIADIVHALQSPTANAPFAPLSDSHTKALTLLMDILHAHVTTDPEALRVATKNKDLDESLRVTAKNKDLNLQIPPTTPTDHATYPRSLQHNRQQRPGSCHRPHQAHLYPYHACQCANKRHIRVCVYVGWHLPCKFFLQYRSLL